MKVSVYKVQTQPTLTSTHTWCGRASNAMRSCVVRCVCASCDVYDVCMMCASIGQLSLSYHDMEKEVPTDSTILNMSLHDLSGRVGWSLPPSLPLPHHNMTRKKTSIIAAHCRTHYVNKLLIFWNKQPKSIELVYNIVTYLADFGIEYTTTAWTTESDDIPM